MDMEARKEVCSVIQYVMTEYMPLHGLHPCTSELTGLPEKLAPNARKVRMIER